MRPCDHRKFSKIISSPAISIRLLVSLLSPHLPLSLPGLHTQHKLPHHRHHPEQQSQVPVPHGGQEIFLLDQEGLLPPPGSPPANSHRPRHPQPGVLGGDHGELRRGRHPVHRPSCLGLPGSSASLHLPGGGGDQPLQESLQSHHMGGLCPALGGNLRYFRHLESHQCGRGVNLSNCLFCFEYSDWKIYFVYFVLYLLQRFIDGISQQSLSFNVLNSNIEQQRNICYC